MSRVQHLGQVLQRRHIDLGAGLHLPELQPPIHRIGSRLAHVLAAEAHNIAPALPCVDQQCEGKPGPAALWPAGLKGRNICFCPGAKAFALDLERLDPLSLILLRPARLPGDARQHAKKIVQLSRCGDGAENRPHVAGRQRNPGLSTVVRAKALEVYAPRDCPLFAGQDAHGLPGEPALILVGKFVGAGRGLKVVSAVAFTAGPDAPFAVAVLEAGNPLRKSASFTEDLVPIIAASVLTGKSFTFSRILMGGGENGEGSGRCDRTR